MFTDEVSGAEDLGIWDWDAIKYGYITALKQTHDTSTTFAKEAFYAMASYEAWRNHQIGIRIGAY